MERHFYRGPQPRTELEAMAKGRAPDVYHAMVAVLGRLPIVTPVWVLPLFVAFVGLMIAPPVAAATIGFVEGRRGHGMSSRATVVFGNYGVTDRFDVGFAVPFVHVSIDATVDGTIHRTASFNTPLVHSFDGAGADHATFFESGSSTGLGDISVRAKYNFLRGDTTSLAGFLDLRMPTGDKDELLGTGATRTQMLFVYSGDYGRVSPHVNFGYTFSKGESSAAAAQIEVDPAEHRTDTITGGLPVAAVDLEFPDELNYIFGVNFAAHPRVTVGFDIHGRTLKDTSRFELRDNTYPNRGPGALPSQPYIALSEFTLIEQKENLNLLLGVIGGKFNIGKTLLLNANLLFPMSDGGLKPNTTLSIGFDYVF